MVTKIRNGGLFLEFQKIKLHRSEKNRAAVTQITLDDDYNVPDYRQDIVKVIKERGELRFDEVKAMGLHGSRAVWFLRCFTGAISRKEK